jgi:hypothetical protein
LVIGGYGGFGARLSRRLAGGGHDVLIAGRSAARAEECATVIPGAKPVVLDRDRDIAPILVQHRPDLVIDAAGPFQASGYRVPLACIAAGISYLDLADARDFVTGIGALDGAAQAAGVAVVSGASSVPALSGAVARRLALGLDRVTQVESAISASNRATAGPSVAAAILSYVGKPVRVWRGQRWVARTGWQELRRERFEIAGARPITGRLVALCDVPDHQLLPDMLPGRPAVTFRAGTELRFQMLALWLASWHVRWGWPKSLSGLAPSMRKLQRLTRWAGTDRSAMSVTLKGLRGGALVERRWTLLAEQGDGPEIPTLAAALLAEEIVAGRIVPGARDASDLLTLDRFDELFAGLAIRHQIVERVVEAPLYGRVMGEDFARLRPLIRRIHLVHGDGGAAGEALVRRGTSLLARLAGWMIRFPPAGTHPLHVHFAEQSGAERWTRHFGPHSFSSKLRQHGRMLVERFGPLSFNFELVGDEAGLEMLLRRWTCLGLPLPFALAPRTQAREWQEGERFHFDVRIAVPLAGDVVHYSGWLRPLGGS